MVECLYNLSIQECDVCLNCQQFKNTINHDCSIMLNALGEYQDMSISNLAPLTFDLLRSHIPLGRAGKKAYGFMSLKEPLVGN